MAAGFEDRVEYFVKMWSKNWKASKKPSKQRAYACNAPDHVIGKFVCSHLAKPLREKTKHRSLRVRKGDKVKVLRGQFKGKTGTVDRVAVAQSKVFITGVEYVKKDGGKFMYGIHPSNLLITDLEGNDKRRLGERS